MIALAWPFVALCGLVGAFVLLWRASGSGKADTELTGQLEALRALQADDRKRLAAVEEQQAALKFDVRALEGRD